MKTLIPQPGRCAVTLLEILVVLAIFSMLASLYFPAVLRARHRAQQTACINNLRQTGLAYLGFAQDHHEFPMHVSTRQGGTMEFVYAAKRLSGPFFFAFRHFQALSNDLILPKLLVCPADFRQPAADFVGLRNDNISYVINVAAEANRSDSVLSGDRNITKSDGVPGIALRLVHGETVKWSDEIHQNRGNLLFADGHVDGLTSTKLGQTLHTSLNTATGVVGSVWMPTAKMTWQ